MRWGAPMVSKFDKGEEEDKKGREDITRTYPDDKDKAIAYLKDIMAHAKDNYPESDTGVEIMIDGLVMTIDELIATAL